MVDADRDPLVALARRLTTPVDVPALVADGVIAPRGPWWRRWYEVRDGHRLPEWALCQIAVMRRAGDGAVLVRFARRNVPAERLYAELTGEEVSASAAPARDPHASAPPALTLRELARARRRR